MNSRNISIVAHTCINLSKPQPKISAGKNLLVYPEYNVYVAFSENMLKKMISDYFTFLIYLKSPDIFHLLLILKLLL